MVEIVPAEEHEDDNEVTEPNDDPKTEDDWTVVDEEPEVDEDTALLTQANALKAEGNALYQQGEHEAAIEKYTEAITVCPETDDTTKERSIYHCNRAAAYLKMNQNPAAVEDCTKAGELNGSYVKAWMRRGQAYEAMSKYSECIEDYKKVLEMDPELKDVQKSLQTAETKLKEQQEREKEEMMGKLKDLGNGLLGKFGLSLDNFKVEKDENSGSYSVNFQQGGQK